MQIFPSMLGGVRATTGKTGKAGQNGLGLLGSLGGLGSLSGLGARKSASSVSFGGVLLQAQGKASRADTAAENVRERMSSMIGGTGTGFSREDFSTLKRGLLGDKDEEGMEMASRLSGYVLAGLQGKAAEFESVDTAALMKAGFLRTTGAVDGAEGLGAAKTSQLFKDMLGKTVGVEDFQRLTSSLEAFGLSSEQLAAMQAEVEGGEVTWSGLMSRLSDIGTSRMAGSAKELKPEQKSHLLSFFQKVGFDAAESDKLLRDVQNGDKISVVESIAARLSELPSDTKISLKSSELKALADSLDLSAGGRSTLNGLLGAKLDEGEQWVSLSAREFRSLFQTVRQEAVFGENPTQRVRDLANAVARGMAEVGEREAKDPKLDRLGGDVSERFQTAKKESWLTGKLESQAQSGEQASGPHPDAGQADVGGKLAAREQAAAKAGESAVAGQPFRPGGHASKPDEQPAAQDSWQKSAKDSAGTETVKRSTKLDAENVQAVFQAARPQQIADVAAATQAKVADGAFSQVREAVLQDLGQGRRQLTLRLNPEDLGAVQVVLQVKGDSVRAVIKAESPEAAKAVSDQLHQLKASLESQGLKVEQLDVRQDQFNSQNGTPSGNDLWAGAEGHNLQQEREAKSREERRAGFMRRSLGGVASQPAAVPAAPVETGQGSESLNLIA